MRFFHKDSDKKRKNRKFHPLRRQIAVLFIGLLLLSMVVITLINGYSWNIIISAARQKC